MIKSRQLKNLELGIDSSLSYCSLTLFKNKKILWDRFQKNNFGHEKNLSLMLQKMLSETQITPKNISFLHINNGPARFTAIRNCHALMKGFFFSHTIKIISYKIFEHYFLGINQPLQKNILCIIDTNRRDLAIQKINPDGKLIGKTKTYLIDDQLIELLKDSYALMGNGIEKLKKIKEYSFIKKKIIGPIELKSNFFVKNSYLKKPQLKFPKIIYPYSPV
jgi:tRNA A37 threonylcarbamoyladenosine modification protein TsaB